MIAFPPCKINLGLQVIEKRPDGFHNLVTCFYPVPCTDILEIIPSASFSFSLSGDTIPGDTHDNLCVRAYQLLKKDFDLPAVSIHLHKTIPAGAGLGGGSSDAAFVLRVLNEQFKLQLTAARLQQYAALLGSDCAFFIEDKPQLGTGRGEQLKPISISLKGKFLVLVKPAVHVATAEAYRGIVPRPEQHNLEALLAKPVSVWRGVLKNDFEENVFQKFPAIGDVKAKLYNLGASYASMSGSGAAVFGIFESPVQLKDKFPGMFYWSGELMQ